MTNAPPLGGLSSYQEAARAHGSVEEAVRFLRRLARIERRTLLVLAAHLNAVPEREVKCALSLHIWQDAEHCAWLRGRMAELRKPPHYLDRPDDAALEAFFEELLRSRSTRELLTGVYHVLKPSVTAAIEEHVRQANPLAEQPTLRLLRFVLLEEREQLEWARAALEASGGVDTEWEQHLAAYLRGAGGVSGRDARAAELPPPHGARPLELVRTPRRDSRFKRLWNSRGRLPGYDAHPDEVRWRMLYVRLTEMHVPERLALTLYEWPDATFEVHRALARHLWDEARHAMMREVGFETRGADWQSVPHEISFAAHPNTTLEPRERYALFYHAEHAVMGRKPGGKPSQHAAAAASGDALTTLFHDYDWAYEILHVHIGRRVLAGAYATADERDEAGARAWADYERILTQDRAADRFDWWSDFYAGVREQST